MNGNQNTRFVKIVKIGTFGDPNIQKGPHVQCKRTSLMLKSIGSHLFRVEVVKHHGEVDGKSTAVHAAVIAPSSVTIHTFPDIPEYDPDDTILVFPGKNSFTLEHILMNVGGVGSKGGKMGSPFPFSTVVFVDSTWNQCHGICQDPR